jgi:hypothetical protein
VEIFLRIDVMLFWYSLTSLWKWAYTLMMSILMNMYSFLWGPVISDLIKIRPAVFWFKYVDGRSDRQTRSVYSRRVMNAWKVKSLHNYFSLSCPCSRLSISKLCFLNWWSPSWSGNWPPLMKPEVHEKATQQPATGPYPQPYESSPYPHTELL